MAPHNTAHCSFPLTATGPTVFILTVMVMKYLTIGVRWCRPPQDHINLNHDKAQRWHMIRWTSPSHREKCRDLTVICTQVDCGDIEGYIQDTLRVMICLWGHPKTRLMTLKVFDELLGNSSLWVGDVNRYSVMYTDITPGYSFYNHVIATKSSVSMQEWSLKRNFAIVADEKTSFKLCCTHVSSSTSTVLTTTLFTVFLCHVFLYIPRRRTVLL